MSKPFVPKAGTTAECAAFTGLENEVVLDEEKGSLIVHDGVTVGGAHEILPKAKNDELYEGKGSSVKSVNGKKANADGDVPFTIGESEQYNTYKDVDLDTFVEAGVYVVSASSSTGFNYPAGTNGVLVVYSAFDTSGTDRFVRQVFYRIGTIGSNDFQVFTRTRSANGIGPWYQVMTSAGGTLTGDLIYGTDTMVIRQNVSDKYLAIRGGNAYANGASLVLYGKDSSDTPGAARLIAHNGSNNYSLYCYPDGRMTWLGRDLSSFAMPQGGYTALTFGANNTTYTAPSDGWVQARMSGNVVGQYLMLTCSNGLEDAQFVVNNQSSTTMCRATIPVKKGDVVTLAYTCNGTNGRLRFYPANGVI